MGGRLFLGVGGGGKRGANNTIVTEMEEETRKGSKIHHFETNVNYLGKITLYLFDPVSM